MKTVKKWVSTEEEAKEMSKTTSGTYRKTHTGYIVEWKEEKKPDNKE